MLVAQVSVLKLPMMQLLQVERVGPPLACLLVAVLRGEAGLALDCYSSLLQVTWASVWPPVALPSPMDALQAVPRPAALSSLPMAGPRPPLGSLVRVPRGVVQAVRPSASAQWLQCRVCGAECQEEEGGPRCQACGGRRADWRITLVVKLAVISQ
jgi:hypothetical protein